VHFHILGILTDLAGPTEFLTSKCKPALAQGITMRLQCSQNWLNTAGCGFGHTLHSFLCCITHRSDVGVALLSGGISCRNYVTSRTDQGQVGHLIYCILEEKKKKKLYACKHDPELPMPQKFFFCLPV